MLLLRRHRPRRAARRSRTACAPVGRRRYANVLLDGIWLREPYLHNGSVPALGDLLKPAACRARSTSDSSRRSPRRRAKLQPACLTDSRRVRARSGMRNGSGTSATVRYRHREGEANGAAQAGRPGGAAPGCRSIREDESQDESGTDFFLVPKIHNCKFDARRQQAADRRIVEIRPPVVCRVPGY